MPTYKRPRYTWYEHTCTLAITHIVCAYAHVESAGAPSPPSLLPFLPFACGHRCQLQSSRAEDKASARVRLCAHTMQHCSPPVGGCMHAAPPAQLPHLEAVGVISLLDLFLQLRRPRGRKLHGSEDEFSRGLGSRTRRCRLAHGEIPCADNPCPAQLDPSLGSSRRNARAMPSVPPHRRPAARNTQHKHQRDRGG
jgi:hypothetical protein